MARPVERRGWLTCEKHNLVIIGHNTTASPIAGNRTLASDRNAGSNASQRRCNYRVGEPCSSGSADDWIKTDVGRASVILMASSFYPSRDLAGKCRIISEFPKLEPEPRHEKKQNILGVNRRIWFWVDGHRYHDFCYVEI